MSLPYRTITRATFKLALRLAASAHGFTLSWMRFMDDDRRFLMQVRCRSCGASFVSFTNPEPSCGYYPTATEAALDIANAMRWLYVSHYECISGACAMAKRLDDKIGLHPQASTFRAFLTRARAASADGRGLRRERSEA